MLKTNENVEMVLDHTKKTTILKSNTAMEVQFHGILVISPTKDIVQVKLDDFSLVDISENAKIDVVLYGDNGSFKEPVTRAKVLETFEHDNEWSLFDGLECFVEQ